MWYIRIQLGRSRAEPVTVLRDNRLDLVFDMWARKEIGSVVLQIDRRDRQVNVSGVRRYRCEG